MPKHSAVVQTRIDPSIKDKASDVLSQMGLSVSDAMRIVLTRTATEGRFPIEMLADQKDYDAWFKAKVVEALNDTEMDRDHDEVKRDFASKRQALLNQQ